MNPADAPLLQAALSVRPYRASDRDAWSAFVAVCPAATFFHRIEWRDLMEDVFRHRTHYLLAEHAGRIVGVLPLAEVKSLLFGHALISLPFAERAGVAAIEPEAVAKLHEAAAGIARTLGVDHLETTLGDRTETHLGPVRIAESGHHDDVQRGSQCGRHLVRQPRRVDGAVLHLLLDVRLPAGGRPRVGRG